jgi:predicted enzyme related to lactoylglutathione lyase
MNPVSYFEIPALDIDRAVDFYTAVFGFAFERLRVDGKDMALFPNTDGAGGASGALVKGEGYVPGQAGARLYLSVADIQLTLFRTEQAGGALLKPEQAIGAFGFVADIADSEGNCIALYSPVASAPEDESGRGFLGCANGKMRLNCTCC